MGQNEDRRRAWLERIAHLPGNDIRYDVSNTPAGEDPVLKDRMILFLGSSVTFGAASMEQAFPEFMARKDGIRFIKEAVSGTTLADDDRLPNSYIVRMKQMDTAVKADAFMCQLSTNDATRNKPLGVITEGKDLSTFDTGTIIGAMEYVIAYAQKTWHCPVSFYTGTKYDSDLYAQMVAMLPELAAKWGIGVLDLWHDEEMNSVSAEDYALYMSDPIHPTKAGYRDWWTPKFEEFFRNLFAKKENA
ncbi:MAG: SGNH/GDSL hydrolase family protein [Solobacterium sp.]|nr:SGNH/GDSL hydrolase family protein [Solobacterium sp.]